jgi:hypothetical protein
MCGHNKLNSRSRHERMSVACKLRGYNSVHNAYNGSKSICIKKTQVKTKCADRAYCKTWSEQYMRLVEGDVFSPWYMLS